MPCSEKYFHKPCSPLPLEANGVLCRQSATHGEGAAGRPASARTGPWERCPQREQAPIRLPSRCR